MLKQNQRYTIKTIIEEYELPVMIQKGSWTNDFYFRIERVSGDVVEGTAFKNGQIKTRLFGGSYKFYLNEEAFLYGNNTPLWDENGYDKYGFNKQGYDRNGYNRAGYSKNGFNRYGFDQDGYNKWGYNIKGYDRNGFDISGFDRDGYNINGYDRNGFDRQGIDKEGYDRKGYNTNGRDRNGFDRAGYDRFGYDRSGFDRSGYNKLGYDRDGFNKDGYDKNGFNRKGFNKEGYNRRGFNKSGYNREGYDREGYDINGFNKFGVDRQGNLNPKLNGEFKSGETVLYHETYGTGVFTKFSTSSDGLSIHVVFGDNVERRFFFPQCLGSFLFIAKTEKIAKKDELLATDYGKTEYQREKTFFDNIEQRITEEHKKAIDTITKNREKESSLMAWDDEEGNTNPYPVYYFPSAYDSAAVEKEAMLGKIANQPYFAKIDYFRNHNMYIGKFAYKDVVIDWADPQASLYYEYQMYIGNKDFDLSIVRNFDIYTGHFYGFLDAYNKKMSQISKDIPSENSFSVSDERLLKIITAQRENKNVHDIITSIQENQYKIITNSMNEELVVEGCAGSGKTMILFHRLRYLLRNNKSLNAAEIFLLSPTEILNDESNELSETLQLNFVNRFSNNRFYRSICRNISEKAKIFWANASEDCYSNTLIENKTIEALYSEEEISAAVRAVKNILYIKKDKDDFVEQECRFIESQKNKFSGSGVLNKAQIEKLKGIIEEFRNAVADFQDYSINNVSAAIKLLEGGYTVKGEQRKRGVTDDDRRKSAILKKLLQHPFLLSITDKKDVKSGVIIDSPEPYDRFFKFSKENFPVFNKMGLKIDGDEIAFLTEYTKIYDKEQRLNDFAEKDDRNYLFDIIEACIRRQKEKYSIDCEKHYEWELFWSANLLFTIYCFPLDAELIFIDEFQDYSATEYEFMKKLFPHARFNLFGDFKQSISAKGISAEQFSKMLARRNIKKYKVNENYRNAQEITECVNKKFLMSMRPVGIHGNVHYCKLNLFAEIDFDEDERVALLVKNPEDIKDEDVLAVSNIVSRPEDKIMRGVINIMPISLAKGLEFETVAIIPTGMNENEEYVGMTRALDELYICEMN